MDTPKRNRKKRKQHRRKYLHKAAVAARYDVTTRTIDRWVEARVLPPYMYLRGSKKPLQEEAVLDAHDRKAARASIEALKEAA